MTPLAGALIVALVTLAPAAVAAPADAGPDSPIPDDVCRALGTVTDFRCPDPVFDTVIDSQGIGPTIEERVHVTDETLRFVTNAVCGGYPLTRAACAKPARTV